MILFNDIALKLLSDNHFLYLEMKKYSKEIKIENSIDNDNALLQSSYLLINIYFDKNNFSDAKKKELSNDFMARYFEHLEKINIE